MLLIKLLHAKPPRLLFAAAMLLIMSIALTAPVGASAAGGFDKSKIDGVMGTTMTDGLDVQSNTRNTFGGNTSALGIVMRVVTIISRVVGIVLAAFAIFRLILNIKGENPDAMTSSIALAGVGFALIVIPGILTAVLGINQSNLQTGLSGGTFTGSSTATNGRLTQDADGNMWRTDSNGRLTEMTYQNTKEYSDNGSSYTYQEADGSRATVDENGHSSKEAEKQAPPPGYVPNYNKQNDKMDIDL